MSVAIKALASNDLITSITDASPDTVYAATNVTAQVNACSAINTHTSAVVLSLYIVVFGGTAAAVDPIAVQTIAPGESAIISDILGHVVPLGGAIFAIADVADKVRVSVSGIEIT